MLPLLALALVVEPPPVEVFDLVERPATAPVTFRHTDGTAVTVAPFDDGGTSKVRFMPTKPGDWQSDAVGLFRTHPSRRKGPLRVDPKHPHHFVWEGTGEHCFVNGTTCYWLLGVQDDARIAAAIDRLAANKVNRVRVAVNARTTGGDRWFEPQVKNSDAFRFRIDPWPNTSDDPKHPKFDLTRFNVSLWQKLDRLVKHARDRDVLVSVVFHLDGADDGVDPFGGGKAGLKTYAGSEAEWAYYRYAAARLSAYSNVMWDVTNEWHLFRSPEWVNKAGAVLKAADPYKHLTSVHGRGDYPFTAASWSDFALYQSWDDAGAYAFMRKVRRLGDAVRPVPHVNEEYGYEDHYPGPWGGGKKAPARAAANRAGLAWEMGFAGGYQTTGERADVPGQGGWITGLGDDSMKLPGLHKHLADFFTAFEWWACDPVDGGTWGATRMLADRDRQTIALYCPMPTVGVPGPVELPPGRYVGRRFDPQTGKWSDPVEVSGRWPDGYTYPWAALLVRK